MSTTAFRIGMLLVVLLALLVRTAFLFGLEVQTHIAGDINDYVHYAWNLGQHSVYSSAALDTGIPTPDSFRPPGYPLFLLLCMWLAGFGTGWLAWAHALQILASSATVLLTMLLGRTWMKPGPSLLAGVLLALWPHHIVFSSTLLSETMLGFSIALALWLAARAYRKRSMVWTIVAGATFGYAALVNTLIILFPMLLCGLLLVAGSQRKRVLAFLLAFLVLPLGWWAATPAVGPGSPSGLDRAAMNFVQGSWPQYHRAWRSRTNNEISRQIMESIGGEVTLILQDRPAGLATVRNRLAEAPVHHGRWYLLEKPWLLWSWDIQLGWHGIHFLPTTSSAFETHPVLRALHAVMRSANPVVFSLAVLAMIALFTGCLRGRPPPFPAAATALFLAYVTALHVVLQAEPRYAVSYRPEQLLLASMGLSMLFGLLANWRQKKTQK